MANVKFKINDKTVEMPDTPENRAEGDKRGAVVLQDFTNGKQTVTMPATQENFEGAKQRGFTTIEAAGHLADSRAAHPREAYTQAESAGMGMANQMSLGLGDEISGVASAATGALQGDFNVADNYTQSRDMIRGEQAHASEDNPWSYRGGSVVGGLAGGLAGGAAAGTLKAATAGGAIQGFGEGQGTATDQLKSTAIGGVAGLAGGYAGNKLGDYLTGLRNSRTVKALGGGKADMKRLGSEGIQKLGADAFDSGLLGASTDSMLSKAGALKNEAGEAIGTVYSQIDDAGKSTFNPLDVATNFENGSGAVYRDPLNKDVVGQFDNTIETILNAGEGNIPLARAQELKMKLAETAFPGNKPPLNPTPKQEMARKAWQSVSDAIDTAAENGAEGLGGALKDAKGKYSTGIKAEGMLENKAAGEAANKTFGLTDWALGGAGAATIIANPAAAVPVIGALAAKKAAEKWGNQGVALGANEISKLLKANPMALGSFASVLANSEARGSLKATHYLLQQTNSDYRQKLKEASGEQDPQMP